MFRETREFLNQYKKKDIPGNYGTTNFYSIWLNSINYYKFKGELFDMNFYYTDPGFTLDWHITFISEENEEDKKIFDLECRLISKCCKEIKNTFFKNRKWKHYKVKDWKLFLDKFEKLNQKYIKMIKNIKINYKLNKMNEDFEDVRNS